MNRTTWQTWLATVIRLALGGIWIWASISKLHDPRIFLRAVRAYDATPDWLARAIAFGLPVLEFAVGVLLVVGVLTRLLSALSAVLFLIFLVGLLQAAARGIKLQCGCFGGGGISDSTSYLLDILRDLVLLALAVYLVLRPLTRLSLDSYYQRHDHVERPSAKRMRTDEGRRRYESMVATRQREARLRVLTQAIGIGVVVALVCLIGISIQAHRARISGSLSADNASVATGVTLGAAKAPVTLDIYEDFQCSVCNTFEQSAGAAIKADILSGKVLAHYHLMSFLDADSRGNRYSSRAANAAICASDYSIWFFQKYHDELYGKSSSGTNNQPSEGAHGLPDKTLVAYARTAGLPDTETSTFTTCVGGESHKALVEAMTDYANKNGVSGTPTIKVNGSAISAPSLASVTEAIDKAAEGKPNATPPTTSAPSSATTSAAASS